MLRQFSCHLREHSDWQFLLSIGYADFHLRLNAQSHHNFHNPEALGNPAASQRILFGKHSAGLAEDSGTSMRLVEFGFASRVSTGYFAIVPPAP